MKAAQETNDVEAMLAAIRVNWQLWTIIQSELLSPDCQVPLDIRQNVLSLASFIDKHTVGFIASPEARKLNVLISINREIAGGLHDSEVADAAGQQTPESEGAEQALQSTDKTA